MDVVCKKCGKPMNSCESGYACLTREGGELCRGLILLAEVNRSFQEEWQRHNYRMTRAKAVIAKLQKVIDGSCQAMVDLKKRIVI